METGAKAASAVSSTNPGWIRKGTKGELRAVRRRPKQGSLAHYCDPSFIEWFWGILDRKSVPGCWLWPRGKTAGYGAIRIEGRGRNAHAVALELHLGRALGIGPGNSGGRLQANHREDICCRRDCCNPAHLYEGTAAENSADRSRALPPPPDTRGTCANCGTPYDNTVWHYGERRSYCRPCHVASNRRTAERRKAGLVESKGRGRKRLVPCTHEHAHDYVDSRGSVVCRECERARKRENARRRRELAATAGIPESVRLGRSA